ncbi:hypothetical protein GCM10022224_025440 [Nonomuraea antimicrobica]|uniref:Uncharacterized protein n=1 Tax=Nonomuraea antimicrobica TaxID=561173 RepID=A0ABP7BHD3_9ACTN
MVQPNDGTVPRRELYARPVKDRIRITETSCCGAYEWACQGGQFLILRARCPEGYEETGRGLYRQARSVWDLLISAHENEHRRENMISGAVKSRSRRPRARRDPAA